MKMQDVYQKLEEAALVPVLVIDQEDKAIPVCEALIKGGIRCVEITYRTAAASKAMRLVRKNFPEILLGAGTVLNRGQIDDAVDAGADFIVSPGFVKENVVYGMKKGATMIPGCVTPGEMEQAMQLGVKVVKFFPAVSFGRVKALNLIGNVYGDLKFMPTGGINYSNMKEFLSCPYVIATGGIWMATRQMINEGAYEEITENANLAVTRKSEIR